MAALASWAKIIEREFGLLHSWDLASGSSTYRVFLLPTGLEVDLGFTPIADFGPRGPHWLLVFGEAGEFEQHGAQRTRRDDLIGLAWHHVLHARICLERGKPWQAEWLISGIREQVLALACVRLGLPEYYAKGADLLPADLTATLEDTLVRSLTPPELRRALTAASTALSAELRRTDPGLAERLDPILTEFAGPDLRPTT